MAEDRWTYWQRENAGQTDHGVTTMRVFLIAVVVVVLAVVWLGPTVSADESPTSTTRSPCAELQVLRAAGVTHGPDFWAAKGGCRSSYKSSP
jgi:heme A synthase